MLLPSYVEVRDKGVVKKKIRIHGKSFDYVLGELELYFRSARKLLRPGLLEEVLVKIGLPKADIILPSGQTPPQKEEKKVEEKPEEKIPESTPEVSKPLEKEKKIEEEVTSSAPKTDEMTVKLEEETKPEKTIEQSTVPEQKSEEVPEEAPVIPVVEEKKPSIRISISGVDDILASTRTHVTTPHQTSEEQLVEESISEEDVKVESEDTTSLKDTIDIGSVLEEIDSIESETPSDGETVETEMEDSSQEKESVEDSIEHVLTEVEETSETDDALIRPIIEAKALILGEDIVGRATLLSCAGFEPVQSEENADELPYHFKRIVKVKEHRVSLDVWSFDEAVKAGIQRKEFYEAPDVALVVYSVVDRWSFESITYWLKEIAVTNEVLPPVVIVGNKKDLRAEPQDDTGDTPITEKEGFDYAEELATTLAREGNLHPVAFIETSCETKEKVIDAFTIAAELYVKHQLQNQ
jgi:GTPase SAR1 family protein